VTAVNDSEQAVFHVLLPKIEEEPGEEGLEGEEAPEGEAGKDSEDAAPAAEESKGE